VLEIKDEQPQVRSTLQKTYTVQEIAEILGIPVRSAYNICAENAPFKIKRLGRTIRISKESFDDWMNS